MPIAFVITLAAVDEPLFLLTIGPLVWLLEIFSRDRRERYTATLELQRAYRGTVMLLSDVVEFDDNYTAEHSRSVVELVHAVADELGIDRAERQELEFAALLHDVGKIAIPKEILNKPAALTESEFEVMKTHTIEGQFMLDRVGGLLGRVGEIVRSCHERWDGSGYPDGLTGEEIPLASRIVFAADAYNAMTTDRPYRDALPQRAGDARSCAPAPAPSSTRAWSRRCRASSSTGGPVAAPRRGRGAGPARPALRGRPRALAPTPPACALSAPSSSAPLTPAQRPRHAPIRASRRRRAAISVSDPPISRRARPHDEGDAERPGGEGVLDPEDAAREPVRHERLDHLALVARAACPLPRPAIAKARAPRRSRARRPLPGSPRPAGRPS